MTGESIDKLVIQIKADVDDALKGINEVKGDISRLEDRTNKSSKSMVNLASVIKAASIAAVAAATAVGVLGWKMVNLASDAEGVNSKFDAVFKETAKEAEQWAKEFSMAVGRSNVDVKKYMSTFQDTFVPMGFAREDAALLSEQLTVLSVDLASFNNESEPETIESLQSALVGNHETMRKYGVVITQTTLGQELMNMGIQRGIQGATEQQKVQARLNIIMNGTTDAQGDAARTADTFANQMRTLKSSINDVMVEAGDEALGDMANTLKEFNEWGESGGYEQIADGLGEVAKAAAWAADSVATLTRIVVDITKDIEDAKQQTARTMLESGKLDVSDEMFEQVVKDAGYVQVEMEQSGQSFYIPEEEYQTWLDAEATQKALLEDINNEIDDQIDGENDKNDAVNDTNNSLKEQNELMKESSNIIPSWAGKSGYIRDMLDESNKQLDSNYGTEGYGTESNKRKYNNISAFEELTVGQLDQVEKSRFGERWMPEVKEDENEVTVEEMVSDATDAADATHITTGLKTKDELVNRFFPKGLRQIPEITPIPQPIVQLPQSVPIIPNSPIWNSTNSGDVISKLSEIGQIQKDGNTNVDDGNATLLNILMGIKNIERNTSNRSSWFSRIIRDDIDTGA